MTSYSCLRWGVGLGVCLGLLIGGAPAVAQDNADARAFFEEGTRHLTRGLSARGARRQRSLVRAIASFEQSLPSETAPLAAKLMTFATIGVGALGSLLGGVFADRFGRTTLTMLAMAVSGSCAAGIGFLFGGDPWLLSAVCLLWGFTVVADSAQFSASVAELSNRELVGTMLTMQTSVGFLLTMIPVHLVPVLVNAIGWGPTFAMLAMGPVVGCWAMARLRRHPDAVKLANGRR